jgi:hypothetical protein
VTNVGAIHQYSSPFDEIVREFMRVARETVFVSVSHGDIFDRNRHLLDNFVPSEGWSWNIFPSVFDGVYKWVKIK